MQTIWNERQQRRLIDVALLWGKTMLIKSMAATLKTMEAVPLLAFYEKVGRICTSYIMSTINELSLFGFEAVED